MANRFGIPQDVECRLRQKFKVCAYCRREMQEYADVRGCPSDKATIEHLNRHGPFDWSKGLQEEDLVICCGSCNSSRGVKSLPAWFESSYCVHRGIAASTVAEEVKQYLDRQTPSTGKLQPVEINPDWARIAKAWETGGNVDELASEVGMTWNELYPALCERGCIPPPEARGAKRNP